MYLLHSMVIKTQKQPSKGGLRKRFSENIQHIYWRTPMQKYDFNNADLQHF